MDWLTSTISHSSSTSCSVYKRFKSRDHFVAADFTVAELHGVDPDAQRQWSLIDCSAFGAESHS